MVPTCLIVQPPAGPAGYFVRRKIHSLMLHNEKSLSNSSLVWDWGVASNPSHTYHIKILRYMYRLKLLVSRGWTWRTFLYSQVCHTWSDLSSFRGRPVVLDLLLNLVLLLGSSSKENYARSFAFKYEIQLVKGYTWLRVVEPYGKRQDPIIISEPSCL